jgi:hypothetical protein
MFKFFYILYLLVFASVSFAQEHEGIVTPPNNGAASTIYNLPGFTYRNCESDSRCRQLTLVKKNEKIIIKKEFTIVYNDQKKEKFSLVEFRGTYLPTIGYMSSLYLKKESPVKSTTPAITTFPEANTINNFEETITAMLKTIIKEVDDLNYKFPNCRRFITSEGQLGEWGKKVAEVIQKIDLTYSQKMSISCFNKVMDIKDVCPKYLSLSTERKNQFWAYFFSVLASKESNCIMNTVARAVNGVSVGLFQLEASHKLRVGGARDAQFCDADAGGAKRTTEDLFDPDFQINCAISTLRDIHCDFNDRCKGDPKCKDERKKINYYAGYWKELRNNGVVYKQIKNNPFCL